MKPADLITVAKYAAGESDSQSCFRYIPHLEAAAWLMVNLRGMSIADAAKVVGLPKDMTARGVRRVSEAVEDAVTDSLKGTQ